MSISQDMIYLYQCFTIKVIPDTIYLYQCFTINVNLDTIYLYQCFTINVNPDTIYLYHGSQPMSIFQEGDSGRFSFAKRGTITLSQ